MGRKSKKKDNKKGPGTACTHRDFDQHVIGPVENELFECLYQRNFLLPNRFLYVHLSEEKRVIDQNYVRSWYSIAAQDWQKGRRERTLQKTELGIVAEYWMEELREGKPHGQVSQKFMKLRKIPQYLQPPWFRKMEKELENVRRSDDRLIVYLHKKLPCGCLEQDFQLAGERLKEHSETNLDDSFSCTHGENELFTAENSDEISRLFPVFCESTPICPRDFDALCSFMELNPEIVNFDAAAAAYSSAAQSLLDLDTSSTCRRMFTLALTIEVFAEYGPQKVTTDIATMNETHMMELYLREWYTILRKLRCDMRHGIFLISKKVPCGCLDDMKELANELEREQSCEGCKKVYPRAELQTCFKCKIETYCSRECQSKDWPMHKKICKCLASVLEE